MCDVTLGSLNSKLLILGVGIIAPAGCADWREKRAAHIGSCVEDTGALGTIEVTVTVNDDALLGASRDAVDASLTVEVTQCEGDGEWSEEAPCYVSSYSWVDARLDRSVELEAPFGLAIVTALGDDSHSSHDGETSSGYECYSDQLVCVEETSRAIELELACEPFLSEA